MTPRAFLALGILMAALLFIASEVTARETTETANEELTKGAVEDQYGGRCSYGCCGGWYHGRCRRCCPHKGESVDAVIEAAGDAVSDQYGRCRYGCCGGWNHGSCRRCCPHKGKATEVKEEAKPHN